MKYAWLIELSLVAFAIGAAFYYVNPAQQPLLFHFTDTSTIESAVLSGLSVVALSFILSLLLFGFGAPVVMFFIGGEIGHILGVANGVIQGQMVWDLAMAAPALFAMFSGVILARAAYSDYKGETSMPLFLKTAGIVLVLAIIFGVAVPLAKLFLIK